MSCLFGDATDTELELDYIRLIRDLFDFAVEVLRADERIDEIEQALRASEEAAGRDRARIEALYDRLAEVLDPEQEGEGAASRCAEVLGRACRSTIEGELGRLDRDLAREREKADQSRRAQKLACKRALERLLLVPHQLPATETELEVALAGDTGYAGTLRGRAAYGLETVLALDIPAGSALGGAPVRAEALVSGLEVHVPEERGWLSKKVKNVRHKVGRLYIARVVATGSRICIALRAEPRIASEGYDLIVDAGWESPRVLPVAAGGDTPTLMEAHDIDPDDDAAVQELFAAVIEAADPLRAAPTQLLEASLDGVSLEQHDDPTELVDRLFELMGPTVRQIAEHSPQPDELVLKRSISGDRREEIYVTRSELVAKLEVLTPDQRARFSPLGFGARQVPPVAAGIVTSAPRPPAPPPPQAKSSATSTAPPPPPTRSSASTAPPPPQARPLAATAPPPPQARPPASAAPPPPQDKPSAAPPPTPPLPRPRPTDTPSARAESEPAA